MMLQFLKIQRIFCCFCINSIIIRCQEWNTTLFNREEYNRQQVQGSSTINLKMIEKVAVNFVLPRWSVVLRLICWPQQQGSLQTPLCSSMFRRDPIWCDHLVVLSDPNSTFPFVITCRIFSIVPAVPTISRDWILTMFSTISAIGRGWRWTYEEI